MEFPLTKHLEKTINDPDLKKELEVLLRLAEHRTAEMAVASKYFIKTNKVISGNPIKDATLRSLLQGFQETAKACGISEVSIDPNILDWFPGEKMPETIAGPSGLLRFAKDMNHKSIIENCRSLGGYAEYGLCEAVARASALVAADELDNTNDTGIIIYLTNKIDERPCRLDVWRYASGRLGLGIREIGFNDEWNEGSGVLVNNEMLNN